MSMRAQVSLTIRERLIDRAKDFNILLDDVAIVSLFLSMFAIALNLCFFHVMTIHVLTYLSSLCCG